MTPATWVALPSRTASAWWRTQGSAAVDLVVGAVDERDPGAGVVRVPALGLVEDGGHHARRFLDHAGGEPLVAGRRPGGDLGAVGAAARKDVGRGAHDGCRVVDGAQFGHAFAVALLALGQPGRQLGGGLRGGPAVQRRD